MFQWKIKTRPFKTFSYSKLVVSNPYLDLTYLSKLSKPTIAGTKYCNGRCWQILLARTRLSRMEWQVSYLETWWNWPVRKLQVLCSTSPCSAILRRKLHPWPVLTRCLPNLMRSLPDLTGATKFWPLPRKRWFRHDSLVDLCWLPNSS